MTLEYLTGLGNREGFHVYYILNTIYCILYSIDDILYAMCLVVYSTLFILYIVDSILCTVYYILYAIYNYSTNILYIYAIDFMLYIFMASQ